MNLAAVMIRPCHASPRMVLAAVTVVLERSPNFKRRSLVRAGTPWRAFFVMGTLNNPVPFALVFWAQAPYAFAGVYGHRF
jgi:hypothetical protein